MKTATFLLLCTLSSILSVESAVIGPIKKATCGCPLDNFGDTGVLINTFPFFACAYTSGTCDWNMDNGELENTAQGNCPSSAVCPSGTCDCPLDNSGGTGANLGLGEGLQCAYPNGACTFNGSNGDLMNALGQSNCPRTSGCSID
ncbi:hypothetical protein C8Q75DRAFT_713778 [Abortiporus biennis]|nr:hypothetical protein C8Q75DRAFT_713778 [Abortiporus biennis]